MQRRLDRKMGVNKPFENVCHVRGVFQIFFRERVPIFVTNLSAVFSAEVILRNLSSKTDFRGVRGHAPSENF